MVAKNGRICQQEDGSLERGHYSLFGTHYVLLLKMFLFSQGKGQALIDPIKGRTKENILE
jgi:hypothetical protein